MLIHYYRDVIEEQPEVGEVPSSVGEVPASMEDETQPLDDDETQPLDNEESQPQPLLHTTIPFQESQDDLANEVRRLCYNCTIHVCAWAPCPKHI